MFAPTRYLDWARRLYGKTRFDLATSGIPAISLSELDVPSVAELDDPMGCERLRQAIATYHGVPLEETIAALGTTHALWLAYASLAGPGDDILVEQPAYEPLIRVAEGIGARVVRFARDAQDRFSLDPARIADAMTPRTRVVSATNLHNPSGVRASGDALRAVAEVAARAGAHLVVDEVYAPFDTFVDDRCVFGGSARRLAPNVVTVSSLTKCYGLGGQRIGWLLGPADVVARARDTMTACCGALPMVHANLGVMAFARVGVLAERARKILHGKRERVAAWIDSMAPHGLTWSAPDEGLFALVTIPGAGDLTQTIETAARERDVLVAAGAFFDVPNGFRLAWSQAVPLLDEGLSRLADVLKAHGRSRT